MSQETSLFCQVNTPKDANNLTDLEKKHTPVISVPAILKPGEPFEVTVEVGKLQAHPNEPAHFIEWIDLYANYVFLARISLSAATTQPTLKVPVTLPHGIKNLTLRAFERCNMHGVWEGTTEIAIG
jgi:superoxide reductase